jgi:hypothetical protein
MRTLFEIFSEIDYHAQELKKLSAEVAAYPKPVPAETQIPAEPELLFNESQRTVRWKTGTLKLSRKQFLFLKSLWDAKNINENSVATINEIEETIWENIGNSAQNMFVSKNRLFGLLFRLRNSISSVDFPYEIEAVKNNSINELAGYRLVLHEL